MAGLIKVLIVDDSAFVRKMIKAMLSRSAFIEVVGIAFDGAEALELIPTLNPDVVTLDLMMPNMDGVEFLRQQMARRPLPVVVVSIAAGDSHQVVAALAAGAIDFIQKPTALASEDLLHMTEQLIAKVKMAATVKFSMPSVTDSATKRKSNTELALNFDFPIKHPGGIDLVAIGISTGGPAALSQMIPQFPADFPVPIAIVLHMLEGYTKPYAQRLDRESSLNVMEAQEGDLLAPGMVTIARAGKHLKIIRDDWGQLRTHLSLIPANTIHHPSVDVMFESVAQVLGSRVLGVVMTGMGHDGQRGAAMIKAQGGLIFTEDESTCVVYGMPQAVEQDGLSDLVVPLYQMASAIIAQVLATEK